MLDTYLWVEKYRPQTLDDVVLGEGHRALLQEYITAGEIPHLLLAGPPGCGKTTVAKILCKHLDCEVLGFNASKDRGIDIVRHKIGIFAKLLAVNKWKIVFLDEADGMTPDAQNALRNMMEDYSDQTRFILTCNYPHKVISPIQSRCTILHLIEEITWTDRMKILTRILHAEGDTTEPFGPEVMKPLLTYAEKYTDLRQMITEVQKAYITSNGRPIAPAVAGKYTGNILLEKVLMNNWDFLVNAARDPAFDPQIALRDMFWAVEGGANMRAVLAKAVREGMWTPDPVVHFLGTCAELME